MRTANLLLAAALLLSAPADLRAEFNPAQWPSRKAVSPPDVQKPLLYVTVDREIWNASPGRDLRHLRLIAFDAAGTAREIGYAVHTLTDLPDSVDHWLQPTLLNLGHSETETVFQLDLGDSPSEVNRLTINTDSRDYRRAVRIEGSADGNRWYTLRADGSIFDFRGDADLGYNRVSFPPSNYRHYRVTITNGGQEPLEITGAELALVRPRSKTPTEYRTLPAASVERTEDKNTTLVTLDLEYGNLPIERLRISAAGENFWRPVRIMTADRLDVQPPQDPWSTVARTVLFSYKTPRYDRRSDPVRLSSTRYARYVRLAIDNGDNPPLERIDVQVQSLDRRVYFPATDDARDAFAQGGVFLYFGNAKAGQPTYDFQRVFNLHDSALAAAAGLGPIDVNPDYVPPAAPKVPWTEKYPWLIYAALIVAVLVLGALAVRVLRHTHVEPDDTAKP